jgi:hypothetical protein
LKSRFLKSYQILTAFPLEQLAMPIRANQADCVQRSREPSRAGERPPKISPSSSKGFLARPEDFLLANQHLPAIIWGFVGCNTLDESAKRLTFLCGQSISRFRLCGSSVFRRRQLPGETRGALYFGALG